MIVYKPSTIITYKLAILYFILHPKNTQFSAYRYVINIVNSVQTIFGFIRQAK